jgi:hypothetical protein
MKRRASSDLLFNCKMIHKITKIECMTMEDGKTQEHVLNIHDKTVMSNNHEVADPALSAIVLMLHHK